MSHELVLRCDFLLLRIQLDDLDPFPVPGLAGPAFGIALAGALINSLSFGKGRSIFSSVTILGRHEADGAMKVLRVVPGDEALDPLLCHLDALERATRILGPILECSEERFGVGCTLREA